jgi:[ribosomal protein S18]-alanine N-acetyltransferase
VNSASASAAPAALPGEPPRAGLPVRTAGLPVRPKAARVAIASARPSDLDAIIGLEQRCFTVHDRFSRATWRRLLGPSARAGTSHTLVVREGGAVVGTINALLRSTSAAARIYSLAVDPATQGRGIARQLVHALVRRLPRRISAVTLEVRAANVAARALYQRLGMAHTHELPGHYPDGGDGLRYQATRAAVLRALRERA